LAFATARPTNLKPTCQLTNFAVMILQQFPELEWLKAQISQRFANRRGPGDLRLESDGFPSVIIHTKVKRTYRPDITGPISLFLNLKGSSVTHIDRRRMVIDDDNYTISNRQQAYTLEIAADEPVETFNIHIGEHFSEKILQGYKRPSATLLDNEMDSPGTPVDFYNKLYRRDAQFNALVAKLLLLQENDVFDKMLFEETLTRVVMYLLQQHKNILAGIAGMPPVKASVKGELYRRISSAADYMHACYMQNIQLDDIAAAACLSKFHFLRLFKHIYKMSPYQFIQQLRIEKARHYLAATNESVHSIAELLGYENSNSFSRVFKQRTGFYPSQYRN
jgi:AraC family transcriptional regulator